MTVVAIVLKKIISFALILMVVFGCPFPNSSQDLLAANLVKKQTLNENAQKNESFPLSVDAAVIAGVGAASAAAGSAFGSITVGTILTTTAAPLFGLPILAPLASIGLAATSTVATVVALPAAGIVAASGLAVYGGYKAYTALHDGEYAESAPAKETKSDRSKLAQVVKTAHGILQVAKTAHEILP
jgi:hypothetical protein